MCQFLISEINVESNYMYIYAHIHSTKKKIKMPLKFNALDLDQSLIETLGHQQTQSSVLLVSQGVSGFFSFTYQIKY